MREADRPTLRLQRLDHADGLPIPARASSDAAGLDLRAAVATPLVLQPGERTLVPTGFVVALPAGHEGQIRPRSGLALRHGVTVLNSPGTIDQDYRGEVAVVLVNLGQDPITIERGDRIAQLVIAPVTSCEIEEVAALETTPRGGAGFGSTGRW